MTIPNLWKNLQDQWPKWRSRWLESPEGEPESSADDHLSLARESLKDLLEDSRVPESVRDSLAHDYAEVAAMLDRLEHGHIQIAVFGRVSVGKSALLNALLGEHRFSTSPLHGETKTINRGHWQGYQSGNVFLVDTPGINELNGEERGRMAREVASRSDLVLFAVDGDLTDTESVALRQIAGQGRPIVLVLNKLDRYTRAQRDVLFDSLRRYTKGVVDPRNILGASADPAEQVVIRVDDDGNEEETIRQPQPDVEALRNHLWDILDAEGKTLVALNAAMFAGDLSDRVAKRILEAKRHLGQRVIRTYCVGKGVAVAINPIPVADLMAAAAVDITMIVHLSNLYGLPISKAEAGTLVKTIGSQMLLLMGTVWAVHVVSSALKLGTGGLSAIITGGAQGAVAYYSTFVVGQAAELYLAQGKSWGEGGPKHLVREILDRIDRDSIIEQAREDIRMRLSRA